MIGRPPDADCGGNVLRLRYGRNESDVGKQCQTAQSSMHVQRLKFSRRDHEHKLPLRSFHDRCDRDRPHRCETGAAGDENKAPDMVRPEKRTAKRSRQFYSMSDADIPTERGGYKPIGKFSNMKMQQTTVLAPLQRVGRAVVSRREAS